MKKTVWQEIFVWIYHYFIPNGKEYEENR